MAALTTAHLADACIRAKQHVRCAPLGTRPVVEGDRLAGRVLPARHVGSVDIFLEAIASGRPGDVLVVDNGGRLDEACVGDLVVREAQHAGLAGVVIWGLHRDTGDIRTIGLPVFSLGTLASGPLRLDPRPPDALAAARIGRWTVTTDDVVVADDDGAIFLAAAALDDLLAIAESIRDTEHRQAARIGGGDALHTQLQVAAYVEARETNPELTFREHLRAMGGAIEE